MTMISDTQKQYFSVFPHNVTSIISSFYGSKIHKSYSYKNNITKLRIKENSYKQILLFPS